MNTNTEISHEERIGDLQHKDLMEGGGAVVEREKILEEMERIPWWKNFMQLFYSPIKMMKWNFTQDPPQGMSVAVVGLLLFGIIVMVLTYLNPLFKEQIYEIYRMYGIDESQLQEQYRLVQITSTITAVFGLFFKGLITAIVLSGIKLLFKLRGAFQPLCTCVLLAEVVQNAIYCLDLIIGNIIGVLGEVFSLKTLFVAGYLETHQIMGILASTISLNNICFICLVIVGFKIITKASTGKSILVVMIMEGMYFGYQVGINKIGEIVMMKLGML